MHNWDEQIKNDLNLECPQRSIYSRQAIRREHPWKRGRKEVEKYEIRTDVLPESGSEI
jgi:hypothetical protein